MPFGTITLLDASMGQHMCVAVQKVKPDSVEDCGTPTATVPIAPLLPLLHDGISVLDSVTYESSTDLTSGDECYGR